jgi:hypothetical protein
MNLLDRGLVWMRARLDMLIVGRELRDVQGYRKGGDINAYFAEKHRKQDVLLTSIKAAQTELEALFKAMQHDYEDGVYRFYHHSFKVYRLQQNTRRAVALFRKIGDPLGNWNSLSDLFEGIARDGTERRFRMHHNRDWPHHTRPIVEAFLHTRYFLDMMLQSARELETAPQILPSGWASVLYLYEMR